MIITNIHINAFVNGRIAERFAVLSTIRILNILGSARKNLFRPPLITGHSIRSTGNSVWFCKYDGYALILCGFLFILFEPIPKHWRIHEEKFVSMEFMGNVEFNKNTHKLTNLSRECGFLWRKLKNCVLLGIIIHGFSIIAWNTEIIHTCFRRESIKPHTEHQ